jgi:hypothetical protein
MVWRADQDGGPKAAIHSGLESALGSHPCVALSVLLMGGLCLATLLLLSIALNFFGYYIDPLPITTMISAAFLSILFIAEACIPFCRRLLSGVCFPILVLRFGVIDLHCS